MKADVEASARSVGCSPRKTPSSPCVFYFCIYWLSQCCVESVGSIDSFFSPLDCLVFCMSSTVFRARGFLFFSLSKCVVQQEKHRPGPGGDFLREVGRLTAFSKMITENTLRGLPKQGTTLVFGRVAKRTGLFCLHGIPGSVSSSIRTRVAGMDVCGALQAFCKCARLGFRNAREG